MYAEKLIVLVVAVVALTAAKPHWMWVDDDEAADSQNEKRASNIELITLNKTAIAACVAGANFYRNKHETTGALVWDADLARGAQSWANELAKRRLVTDTKGGRASQIKHASPKALKGIGENLFWSVLKGTCADAYVGWEKENSGSYTQLVWKGTKKFGMGIVKGNFGKYWEMVKYPQYFMVGRFSPAGNTMNGEATNVGKKKKL